MENGRFETSIGRRLLGAVAELTQLAGWQAYDVGNHGLAQLYLTRALDLAQAAGDPGLGAEVLAAMSHQATYLGHGSAGVDLAPGRRTDSEAGRADVLMAEASVMEAHAHAVMKDDRACTSALRQAEIALDRADRSSAPQWLGYFDEAYLSAKFGHCFLALGKPVQAARFAARSSPHGRAVRARQGLQPGAPRDRACAAGGSRACLHGRGGSLDPDRTGSVRPEPPATYASYRPNSRPTASSPPSNSSSVEQTRCSAPDADTYNFPRACRATNSSTAITVPAPTTRASRLHRFSASASRIPRHWLASFMSTGLCRLRRLPGDRKDMFSAVPRYPAMAWKRAVAAQPGTGPAGLPSSTSRRAHTSGSSSPST